MDPAVQQPKRKQPQPDRKRRAVKRRAGSKPARAATGAKPKQQRNAPAQLPSSVFVTAERRKRARAPSSTASSLAVVAPGATSQVRTAGIGSRKRVRKSNSQHFKPPQQLKEDPIAFTSHERVALAGLSDEAQAAEPGRNRRELQEHGAVKKRWKVLIVGAGTAGLAAAQQLRSKVAEARSALGSAAATATAELADEVLVLEGGQRLGGRIHTMHFPAVASEGDGQSSDRSLRGCRVDLGASYIHGYDFEDYLERTGRDINPLQQLAKEHEFRTAVDRSIPQQYSNGWRAHAAWFVNCARPNHSNAPVKCSESIASVKKGNVPGRPVVAPKGRENSWNGPGGVFKIDAEIDVRLEQRARELNEMKPPLDSNVYDEWENCREEVLAQEKYSKLDKAKVREILASMAVVKWGFCAPLEERSLCDAFNITVVEGAESGHDATSAAPAPAPSAMKVDVGSTVSLKEDPSVFGTVIGKANGFWTIRLAGAGFGRDDAMTKKFRWWQLNLSSEEQEIATQEDQKEKVSGQNGVERKREQAEESQFPGMYDAMMLDGYGEVIEVLSRGVKVATGARVRSITASEPFGQHQGPITVKVSMARGADGVRGVGGSGGGGGGGGSSGGELILTADCVIVTVSLGVLQIPPAEGGILFTPALPGGGDDKSNQQGKSDQGQKEMLGNGNCDSDAAAGPVLKRGAIDALGFGHENKVVLRFLDRFWRASGGRSGAGEKHTHWQCLDQRFRFINLDAVGKDGTIVAHVGPPFSVDYTDLTTGEKYDDGRVVDEVCECLQNMFDLSERPEPVQFHVTRWTQDDLARGSYSFVANGSGSDMCNTLAEPEWGGRLCFAGEACCEERVQCVDGALVSGRQAAEDVVAVLLRASEATGRRTEETRLECGSRDRPGLPTASIDADDDTQVSRSAAPMEHCICCCYPMPADSRYVVCTRCG